MERNVTLDFVRGVAILGILLLNITAFGLPSGLSESGLGRECFAERRLELGHPRSVCAGKIPHPVCTAVRRRIANAAGTR